LNIGKYRGKNILAVCNDADTVQRNNLTLRISYNEGKSWKENYLVARQDPTVYKDGYTAYSDLVLVDKKDIGILYETDDYARIVFSVYKW
jgi:sialidase-1